MPLHSANATAALAASFVGALALALVAARVAALPASLVGGAVDALDDLLAAATVVAIAAVSWRLTHSACTSKAFAFSAFRVDDGARGFGVFGAATSREGKGSSKLLNTSATDGRLTIGWSSTSNSSTPYKGIGTGREGGESCVRYGGSKWGRIEPRTLMES